MSSNQFVKGALIITVATMLSKIIGSIYRIPLQNIAGDEVLGIFSIVYPVYMSVLTLTVAGIPIAISKLISESRVKGKQDEVYVIYKTATWLAICFGFISFTFIFIFIDEIAALLGGTFVAYPLLVVSITLLVAPYMAIYRGLFQGFENMSPTAISQVIEQLVRVAIILACAYILTRQGSSHIVVASGVMAGSIIGVVASLIYLRMLYRKRKQDMMKKVAYTFTTFKKYSKTILKVALPICIGALAMPLLNMVDSLTVPLQLKRLGFVEEEVAYFYGIYGRGLALVQIAVVFASALILPLIPHITAALAKNETTRVRQIIEKALKFIHLTAWPIAVGLVALTLPINLALFGDLEGNSIVAVLLFSSLFTAFSVLTTGILQGMNRGNVAAVIVIICAVIKVVLNFVFVHQLSLLGAALSTLMTYILLTAINLYFIYRYCPYSFMQKENIVFAFSSFVMGAVVAIPWFMLSLHETRITALLYMLITITIGAAIYSALIILMRGLKKDELQSLPIIGKRIK